MVKLILKSPYIKNTGNAGGYLKYIGTRENVELVPDARPPTKRQTQLINKLLQDFPDCKNSYEYSDYHAAPTKVNASALITMALESNWDAMHNWVSPPNSDDAYLPLHSRSRRGHSQCHSKSGRFSR